jgi:hypothetical protein
MDRKMIKRMNKKGLQFRNAFFSIIIIGMVVYAITAILGGWNEHYDAGLSVDLSSFNKGSEVSATVEGYEGKVSPEDPNTNTDFQSNTLQAVYGIITNLVAPFRVVFGQDGMLDSIASMANIPDAYITPIMTMMILSIVFAIVAIIFKTWRTTT